MRYSVLQRPRAQQLVSGVTDHLSGLLTVVYGRARLAERRRSARDRARDLAVIRSQARRATRLLLLLESWAGHPDTLEDTLDINELVGRVALRCREARADAPPLLLHLGDVAKVVGSRAELEIAVGELVLNALEAHPHRSVSVRTRQARHLTFIEVIDDGDGIAPDVAPRVYDPFFTTKAGEHFGLGLSVAGEVAARHRGDVQLVSAPGRGTTVTLSLPSLTAS